MMNETMQRMLPRWKAAAEAKQESLAAVMLQVGGLTEANPAINRKLIYKAYVTIEVEDFGEARSKIRSLVQLAGGYQLNFNEINSEHDRSGHFTIKVPASGFMDLLNRLEELSPDHYESKVTGQDVTEEYVDLEARLKVLEVTEQRRFVHGTSSEHGGSCDFLARVERRAAGYRADQRPDAVSGAERRILHHRINGI